MAWLNEKISEHTSTMIPTLIPPTESPCRASAPGVEMTKYSNPLTTKLQSISIIFQNLVSKKALLHSDQELFNSSSTDNLVRKYAANYCCILWRLCQGHGQNEQHQASHRKQRPDQNQLWENKLKVSKWWCLVCFNINFISLLQSYVK